VHLLPDHAPNNGDVSMMGGGMGGAADREAAPGRGGLGMGLGGGLGLGMGSGGLGSSSSSSSSSSPASSMSMPQIKNHSVTHHAGYLYCFGGYDGRRNHQSLSVYSLRERRWMDVISTSSDSSSASASVAASLTAGGRGGGGVGSGASRRGRGDEDAYDYDHYGHYDVGEMPLPSRRTGGGGMGMASASASVRSPSSGNGRRLVVRGVPPPGRNGHTATLAIGGRTRRRRRRRSGSRSGASGSGGRGSGSDMEGRRSGSIECGNVGASSEAPAFPPPNDDDGDIIIDNGVHRLNPRSSVPTTTTTTTTITTTTDNSKCTIDERVPPRRTRRRRRRGDGVADAYRAYESDRHRRDDESENDDDENDEVFPVSAVDAVDVAIVDLVRAMDVELVGDGGGNGRSAIDDEEDGGGGEEEKKGDGGARWRWKEGGRDGVATDCDDVDVDDDNDRSSDDARYVIDDFNDNVDDVNDEDDAQIIIIGGWLGAGPYAADDTWVLDISGGLERLRWFRPQTRGTPPGPCNMHSADYIPSRGEVYVFRGGNGREYLNDLHALDVVTYSWRKVRTRGTPPEHRANHSSALLDDVGGGGKSELFVFGGWNGSERLNDVHVLDTETSTWSTPRIMGVKPHPRAGMTLTALRGRLYLFGGSGTSSKCFDDLQVLDREEMAWLDVNDVSDATPPPSSSNRGGGGGGGRRPPPFGASSTYCDSSWEMVGITRGIGGGGIDHYGGNRSASSSWDVLGGQDGMMTIGGGGSDDDDNGGRGGGGVKFADWRSYAESTGGTPGRNNSANPNDEDTVPSVYVNGKPPGRRAGHTATAVGRHIYVFGGKLGPQRLVLVPEKVH
jgi:hypothetical protein